MLKNIVKRAFVFFVVTSLLIIDSHLSVLNICEVFAAVNTVTVKATTVNVRSGPGTSYKSLGTVTLGDRINPLAVVRDNTDTSKQWYKFDFNNQEGYVRSDFCKEMIAYTYDAMFEADLQQKGFPESYKVGLRELHANYPNWIFTLHNTGMDFNYAVTNELVGTKTLVRANAISSYKSTDAGKYDYTTSTWPTFDGSAWVCASKEVTESYMDPRNFLYDPYIFQFEHHTFNVTIHSLDGIKEMVKGTFLDSKVTTEGIASINGYSNVNTTGSTMYLPSELPNPNLIVNGFTVTQIAPYGPGVGMPIDSGQTKIINSQGNASPVISNSNKANISEVETSYPYTYLPAGTYTYAELIYDACRQVNVNPYVIVSMILQEQGKNGSDSISGKNAKFKNAYNYGNINAYASGGLTSVENGLKYALEEGSYNRPWNTKEKGIYGLCDFYANSYVKTGQDTFYLKKWNVQGENAFKHQYMTNVAGASAEGQILGKAYDEKMYQMPHEFKIPIYYNMKEENYPIPTKDGSPNNKLKILAVANNFLTPSFNPDTTDYSLIVEPNISSVQILAEAYDKKASIGGVGNIMLTTANTYAIVYCVAENGDIRQYTINIYRKGMNDVMNGGYYQNNNIMPPVINPSFLPDNSVSAVIPIIN